MRAEKSLGVKGLHPIHVASHDSRVVVISGLDLWMLRHKNVASIFEALFMSCRTWIKIFRIFMRLSFTNLLCHPETDVRSGQRTRGESTWYSFVALSFVTSLPLKKARSSIGAPMVSTAMRPLLYPPLTIDATPPPCRPSTN